MASLSDRYRKWDNIEISDDEDDTHPNVDTPSLFKWRHEARLQRKAEKEKEQQHKEAWRKKQENRIQELRDKLEKLKDEEGEAAESQRKGVQKELDDLKSELEAFLKKEAELEQWEREHPQWDVDNISKEKTSKTVINKFSGSKTRGETMEMTEYFKKYGDEVQAFGKLTSPKASQQYLGEHPHLVCEHLASYLIVWCVDLEVEEEHSLVKTVARQTITAQYIMELAKSLKRDPRDCVNAFFARLATAEEQYKAAFEDEYNSLLQRVKQRAKERIAEAEAKAAEEERQARLGPAGLDPLEVLESLPPKIKKAFKEQNTPLLQEGFAELSPEDFKYHYDRVVGSGLWVPQGGAAQAADEGAGDDSDSEEEDEEFHDAKSDVSMQKEDAEPDKSSATSDNTQSSTSKRSYVPVEDTVD